MLLMLLLLQQVEYAARWRLQVPAIRRIVGRSQRHVADAGPQHFPVGVVQLQPPFHHRIFRVRPHSFIIIHHSHHFISFDYYLIYFPFYYYYFIIWCFDLIITTLFHYFFHIIIILIILIISFFSSYYLIFVFQRTNVFY